MQSLAPPLERPEDAWDDVPRLASAPTWLRRAFSLVPVAIAVGMLLLHAVWLRAYLFAAREDGLVEWFTVTCYVAAAVMAVLLATSLRARRLHVPAALHLLLALGLLFVAGEEASWGQRQLGYSGPEALVERNLQDEANLHNLLGHSSLHLVYIAVGLYGAFGGRLVRRLPVLGRHPRLYAPPRSMSLYFLLVALYYGAWFASGPLADAFGDGFHVERVQRFQEVPEMVLGLGFLLFVANSRELVGRGRSPAGEDGKSGRPSLSEADAAIDRH